MHGHPIFPRSLAAVTVENKIETACCVETALACNLGYLQVRCDKEPLCHQNADSCQVIVDAHAADALEQAHSIAFAESGGFGYFPDFYR